VPSLLDQIDTSPGLWYAISVLASALFSMLILNALQKQSAFSWQGQQCTFTVLPQGYITSPSWCHNLVSRDLFLNYSFIHMCIHCLGHFSPLASLPHPLPPHFQAEPVLPLSLILLKKRHKHNKEDKVFLLVELRIAIQRDS
jgi:hypothetical protein